MFTRAYMFTVANVFLVSILIVDHQLICDVFAEVCLPKTKG